MPDIAGLSAIVAVSDELGGEGCGAVALPAAAEDVLTKVTRTMTQAFPTTAGRRFIAAPCGWHSWLAR
jgi:hypothetical protein